MAGRRGTAIWLAIAAATALCRASALASPPGSGWDLIFADEFAATSLDSMKWIPQYPWGPTHNHQAYASSSALSCDGSALTITATNTPTGGKPFTSGTISTGYNLFRYTQGYVEARLKLPSQPGSWPAFWMLDNGWPPEVDIMEDPLRDSTDLTRYKTNYHYVNTSGVNASIGTGPNHGGVDLSAAYHTYGVNWTSDTLSFYFDGAVVRTFTNAAAVADMTSAYLILNYAVGDTTQWGGELPDSLASWQNTDNQMQVDWVRAWQQRPGGSTTTSVWNTDGNGSWDSSSAWSGLVPKYSGQQARFGRVGTAAASSVTWSNSRTLGSVVFEGDATGTTAYTIGSSASSLQMAGSGGATNASIQALSTSQANQTINARLELYNTTNITNDMDGYSLILAGQIIGAGGLSVDGVGVVQFSNNNTYTGDTTIDSGTQGAAIARVTRSRPFGTVGVVNLGPAGNATTARIEIRDNRDVPNTINFAGRNNPSVGIQNLSGNNTFSGTIVAQVGGANYIIQSDAGLLTLSGSTPAANGVAMRSAATGSRTFTLRGAGEGAVSGSIQNGAATLSIIKADAGTWTLSGDNTYSGTTSVNGGTLVVNGAHVGGGAYAVAANALLRGTGTIDPAGTAALTILGGLAPGNSVGTLTVGSASGPNNLVMGEGSQLQVAVGAAGSSGRVTIFGSLDLSAATEELRLTSLPGGFDGSAYTIATFTPGTLGGQTFGALYLNGILQQSPTGLMDNGYRLQYQDAAGAISLLMVPEPSSLAWVLGSLVVLQRRSRKMASVEAASQGA